MYKTKYVTLARRKRMTGMSFAWRELAARVTFHIDKRNQVLDWGWLVTPSRAARLYGPRPLSPPLPLWRIPKLPLGRSRRDLQRPQRGFWSRGKDFAPARRRKAPRNGRGSGGTAERSEAIRGGAAAAAAANAAAEGPRPERGKPARTAAGEQRPKGAASGSGRRRDRGAATRRSGPRAEAEDRRAEAPRAATPQPTEGRQERGAPRLKGGPRRGPTGRRADPWAARPA